MSDKKGKQKGFRFSNLTITNLKELVDSGVVRNETEAVDLAIMKLHTEWRMKAPRLGLEPRS